jgi:hypothetical protein
MKRVTIIALVGALVCGILSTWVGPKAIAYWYAPPVPSGAASAFNCTDAVAWAMHKLVLTQIVGTLFGALIGVIVGLASHRREPPPRATPAPAPTKTS